MHREAVDTLGNDGVYFDPLSRIEVRLTATEQRLLRTWPVRRLAFIAHAGAASITTVQTYSRLEHSLGVLDGPAVRLVQHGREPTRATGPHR